MKRVIKIGMDVHSKEHVLCAVEPKLGGEPEILAERKVPADFKHVLKFAAELRQSYEDPAGLTELEFECGYEAGCLGYSLYNQLMAAGMPCVILAPTTMMVERGKRVKTDARDARQIAKCLAFGVYKPVHVLDETDHGVRSYVRMRDDKKKARKSLMLQITAHVKQLGYSYDGTKWTQAHLKWLEDVQKKIVDPYDSLTLREQLADYESMTADPERYEEEIENIAKMERYAKAGELGCLLGTSTVSAVTVMAEIGDFERFDKGNTFAAYLGLAPGEYSSGDHVCRTGISKAGNSTLRRRLIEASQGICKGNIGHKSKALKARQAGQPPEAIAYADMANKRMRRKYYRMIRNGKARNVAVAAIARELACFIWGIMTGNIHSRTAA